MVFAKTPKAAASLSAQVQKRSFGKKYYALVDLPKGSDTFAAATGLPEEGTLRDAILFQKKENCSKIVPEGTQGAQRAVLDYRVLTGKDHHALLDITLHTGRHHQIRAQLSNLHTPICGDSKYGSTHPGQLSLCSYYIRFIHPKTGQDVTYTITPHNEKISGLLPLPKP
jgi:23S rRNA pseudouridine1911/1915/1917 synthase